MLLASHRSPAFAFSGIELCLPEKTVDARTWATRCGLPEARASALLRHGAHQFRDAEAGSPVRLACQAVAALLESTKVPRASVDALIYCHTIQTSVFAPPASSAQFIQSHLGLRRALAFSLSQQNCVSPMAAIGLLHALRCGNALVRRAIVVCADVMGTGCDRLRAIQDLALHSDGACAFLLERGKERNRVEALHLYTDARYFRGTDEDMQPVPDDRYYWSAFSTMRSALSQARITSSGPTHVLPHHVNRAGWLQLMTMLRVPTERLHLTNFSSLGHVFGADPFINLRAYLNAPPGEHSLLFSSGLAGCFGALVVRH